MYAPRVFASMIIVLIVFAVAAYVMTGSILTALVETILCAVILQVGYFVGVLYLVRREKSEVNKDGKPDAKTSTQGTGGGLDQIRAEAARLRTHE